MYITVKNKIILALSQIGAWGLFVFASYNYPLYGLLYPIKNNVPAAFILSIWLTQSLLVTNLLAALACRLWKEDNSDRNFNKLFILHLLVSVLHILLFYILLLALGGGEDL